MDFEEIHKQFSSNSRYLKALANPIDESVSIEGADFTLMELAKQLNIQAESTELEDVAESLRKAAEDLQKRAIEIHQQLEPPELEPSTETSAYDDIDF